MGLFDFIKEIKEEIERELESQKNDKDFIDEMKKEIDLYMNNNKSVSNDPIKMEYEKPYKQSKKHDLKLIYKKNSKETQKDLLKRLKKKHNYTEKSDINKKSNSSLIKKEEKTFEDKYGVRDHFVDSLYSYSDEAPTELSDTVEDYDNYIENFSVIDTTKGKKNKKSKIRNLGNKKNAKEAFINSIIFNRKI